jgi:hypothetical protein
MRRSRLSAYRSVPFIVSGSLCYSALSLATSVSDDHGFIEAKLATKEQIPEKVAPTGNRRSDSRLTTIPGNVLIMPITLR